MTNSVFLVRQEMHLDPWLCTGAATGAGLVLLLLFSVLGRRGQKLQGALVLISGASQGIGEGQCRLDEEGRCAIGLRGDRVLHMGVSGGGH
jgi:hypothetical protein